MTETATTTTTATAPTAPSSRIFVRGLPPSITDDDFRSHFAKRYNVTDSKLLAKRRIGYVGFKSAEDALSAVKYFNKSFIRMSKIAVELADNVSLVAVLLSTYSAHTNFLTEIHRPSCKSTYRKEDCHPT